MNAFEQVIARKPPLNLPQRGRLLKKYFKALSFGEGWVRRYVRNDIAYIANNNKIAL
jgi:hypothetical protein